MEQRLIRSAGILENQADLLRVESSEIFDKIRSTPILPTNLQYFPAVHVIELAETGYIKPHIDSIKVPNNLHIA